MNIHITLLITKKLCQSKSLQNVYPAQESFILLYSIHDVYQAQNCWKCKEIDLYTSILTLQTLGFEHKPRFPEHCITQLMKINNEWNQRLNTPFQQNNETRFREKCTLSYFYHDDHQHSLHEWFNLWKDNTCALSLLLLYWLIISW